MELTEQRRLKEEAAAKEILEELRRLKREAAEKKAALAKIQAPEKTPELEKVPETKPLPVPEPLVVPLLVVPVAENPQINEEIKTFVEQVNIRPSQEVIQEPRRILKEAEALPVSRLPKEDAQAFKSRGPAVYDVWKASLGPFALSLAAFFLIVPFKFSQTWMAMAGAKFNSLIMYGSFFILSAAQEQCTIIGGVLRISHYKVFLQGDPVALYSLKVLIFLATLYACIQKTEWSEKGKIFISLIPLALIANVLRVLWACGLALNYGNAFADGYFHGFLVVFVFIFVVLGLMFLEFISSPD
jgi:exosortase/archaeosortase family protein